MSIFLLVLKIAGLILLVLLGLFLLLVFVILFCPIKYLIKGSFHDKKLNMKAGIYFLFHLAGFSADIGEAGSSMYIRIFGIKKNLRERDNPEKFEDTNKKTGPDSAYSGPDSSAGSELTMLSVPESGQDEPLGQETWNQETGQKKEHGHFVYRIRMKFIHCIEQIRQFFGRLVSIITNIREKTKEFKGFFSCEENRAAFRKLKKNLFSVLKHLSPKKSKLDLKFSAGSPDITGELLGVFSLFPTGYKYHWNILPDFAAEKAYFETDFDFRGYLYGIQILVLLLGIVLDKNCQNLYNKIMTRKECT